MKKIVLLIAVFTMTIGIQMQAQVNSAVAQETAEQVNIDKKAKKESIAGKRKHKKQAKKAQKAHIKSMTRVAEADGVITAEEKQVIEEEKTKMKAKNNERKEKIKAKKEEEKKLEKTQENRL